MVTESSFIPWKFKVRWGMVKVPFKIGTARQVEAANFLMGRCSFTEEQAVAAVKSFMLWLDQVL